MVAPRNKSYLLELRNAVYVCRPGFLLSRSASEKQEAKGADHVSGLSLRPNAVSFVDIQPKAQPTMLPFQSGETPG